MASSPSAPTATDSLPPVRLPISFLPGPRHVSFTVPRIERHPRKVIIAYEHSKYSDAILDRAIRTGLIEPEDEIYLVYILQQTDIHSLLAPRAVSGAMPSFDADLHRQETEYREGILRNVKEDMLIAVSEVLKKHSFNKVHTEVIQGDPKYSLVDYCKCIKPTFLAMGSRGRGKLKSSILGSVSEYLARHCPCPVMIVKVTEEDVEARKEQNNVAHSSFMQRLTKFGIHT